MHKNKIRIKNFGPIKEGYTDSEDGFFEIEKLTVLTGIQGSGKSTIAKLISTFLWLEKALVRKDFLKEDITKDIFVKNYLAYHLIDSYIQEDSEIEFIGTVYSFHFFTQTVFEIKKREGKNIYLKPKITYILSERNLYSVLPNPNKIAGILHNAFTTLADFEEAKKSLNGKTYDLPIADYKYRYEVSSGKSYIFQENNGYEIELFQAASGIQSALPIALISNHFSSRIENSVYGNAKTQMYSFEELQKIQQDYKLQIGMLTSSSQQDEIFAVMNIQNPWMFNFYMSNSFIKKDKIKKMNRELTEKESEILTALEHSFFATINSCFVNIVEEPEQNLYPASQCDLMCYLLECINKGKKENKDEKVNRSDYNKLIITTHSPYIPAYLNTAIKAYELGSGAGKKVKNKLKKTIPEGAWISGKDVAVYELSGNGRITHLKKHNELFISDKNILNQMLENTNDLYADLLEIEYGT